MNLRIFAASNTLRGEVEGGAHKRPSVRVDQFPADAEIAEFDLPSQGHEDVGGLDVYPRGGKPVIKRVSQAERSGRERTSVNDLLTVQVDQPVDHLQRATRSILALITSSHHRSRNKETATHRLGDLAQHLLTRPPSMLLHFLVERIQ